MELENKELAVLEEMTSLEKIKSTLTPLLDSKFFPKAYDSIEKVMVSVIYGRELNLSPMSSIQNINVIENKPTLSVHAIAALIRRGGVSYILTEDAVWIRSTGEVDAVYMMKTVMKDNVPVKTPMYDYVDCRTTIRFRVPYLDGSGYYDQDISFYRSEAHEQGLLTKDNWKKMFKIMMRTRCLTIGARFVKPECFMGAVETTEHLDYTGKNYEVQESADGFAEVTILN